MSAALHGPRGRRGFVIPLAMALVFLLAVTGMFVLRDLGHRDVWTHRYSSGEIALSLAQGAVSNVLFASRRALEPVPRRQPRDGPLYSFLLQDCEALEKSVEGLRAQSEDHTPWLELMLGARSLEPIGRLLDRYPGAKLRLRVDFKPRELHGSEARNIFADPIEKDVLFRVAATVEHGGAMRTAWSEKMIRVYSILPPVTPRFTAMAFQPGGPAESWNDLSNGPSGTVTGDAGPTVLYNSGEPVERGLELPDGARAGLLLFGVERVPFKLTSGLQNYHLAAGGPTPVSFPVENAPPGILNARLPDPDHPGVEQALLMQASFWGYYLGIDEEHLLAPDLDERSSRLHLFGDAAHPSPTLVVGRVYQRMAMISGLGVDRDATGKDEADQRDSCGLELPIRESRDPFLRAVTPELYAADSALEAANRPPASLVPFNSPGMPPYTLVNMNALADSNADGIPDTPVPSEAPYQPFRVDPSRAKYSELFGDFSAYDPWRSREVDVPYNTVTELMKLTQKESWRKLSEQLLPFRGDVFAQDLADVAKLRLPYSDPVHDALSSEARTKAHLDVTRGSDSDLAELRPEDLVASRVILAMPSVEFLARYLVPGNKPRLNMQGHAVAVTDGLELPGGLEIAAGGLVLAPSISFAGSVRTMSQFSPFGAVAGSISVAPEAIVQAAVFGRSLAVTQRVLLAGSLGAGTLRDLAQWKQCRVVYDARFDPTGPDADLWYREAMSDRDFAFGITYRDGKELMP